MPSTIFSADDANGNTEIWITDGTSLRTHKIAEIRAGANGSFPSNFKAGNSTPLPFAVLNGFAYFSATTDGANMQLWKTDGTAANTVQITSFAGAGGAAPSNIVATTNAIYFLGNGASGSGIYKSDGVNTPTFISAAAQATALVATGNRIYWTTEPGNGSSVFSSDGVNPVNTLSSSSGASTLTDVGGGFVYYGTNTGLQKISGTTVTAVTGPPGFPTGSTANLTNAGGTVFFTLALNPTSLWTTATSGSAATQIKTGLDLDSHGQGNASAFNFAALGTKIIFANNDDLDGNAATNTGYELWISDGTTNGTVLLKDLITGADPFGTPLSSAPKNFTTVGNTVFFTASDGHFGANNGFGNPSGIDLWKTDGTANGTVLVKHIASLNPGPNGAQAPQPVINMTALNGILYFSADSGTGYELWRSDGTANGTFKVSEINSTAQAFGSFQSPQFFSVASIGGITFFTGADDTNGHEIWTTNGTIGGTTLLKDINPGIVNSLPSGFTALGNNVIFAADDGSHGREFWVTDGTPNGTQLLKDINPNGDGIPSFFSSQFTDVLGGKLLFIADDGSHGQELWATDGTANGTTLLVDIFTGSTNNVPNSSTPNSFVNVGTNAFFQATSSLGTELYVTDGTAQGTHIVRDIAPGSTGGTPNSPGIQYMTPFGGKLFFAASDLANSANVELWSSDGTANGTQPVKEINTAPFDQNNPTNGSALVSSLTVANGHLFFFASTTGGFSASPQLWMSDGTAATTNALTNVANYQPQQLTAAGTQVYYSASTTADGSDLFTSSGAAPTAINIAAGNASSSPNNLTNVNGTLFLSAQDTTAHGTELWKVAGNTASLVKDINPTVNAGSSPTSFLAAGSNLFFVADDGSHGAELWVSDGVVNGAGTHLVKDINTTANQGSSVSNLKLLANGLVMFQANDGINGNEIYITDGTSNGTFRATDVHTLLGANPNNMTSLPLDLAAGPETLTGTPQPDFIDGGGGNDTISGLAQDDTLIGGAGDDTIDGGPGNDTMTGGLNNDTYVVDSLGDAVNENPGEGTDTVLTALGAYTLAANVENLTGTSNASQTLTGNGLPNLIQGGPAADNMVGAGGNDVYVVNNLADNVIEQPNDGIDAVNSSVDYTLAANVENLILSGNANLSGGGNELSNSITGNGGNNTLDGRGGPDILSGLGGDDNYLIDDVADQVVEGAAAGNDTIYTTVNFTMSANVEFMVLQGTADLQGYGNALPNSIVGNSGSNILDGGAGADSLSGGQGNDFYFVDNISDVISELANQGTDTVFSTVNFTLAPNVENLVLQGGSDLQGYGNTLVNQIFGNTGSNILDGGAGSDTMIGGGGNDFYFIDEINDIASENANEGTDTVYSSVNITLGANLENLNLLGSADLQGYGNGLVNTLFGNSGGNILDGGVGADSMSGGGGNDFYYVDNANDAIGEANGAGNDTVFSTVNYTLSSFVEVLVLQGNGNLQGFGSAQANTLYGNIGNNTLNGMVGADTMIGGAGDDTYVVDNINDTAVELGNEGFDTVNIAVNFTLGANVEKLLMLGNSDLQGYGNAENNVIQGNIGNNILDGGIGSDAMIGGIGNDSYFVDNMGDVVTENPGEGSDTVYSTIDLTLAANADFLVLTGNGNLQGYGNGLNNAIYGNGGSNILDGGVGGDALYGGAGNDFYTVDNISDLIIENAGEGTDTVNATVNFTLSANVETLLMQGNADLQGFGSAGANTIFGNSGNNLIDGAGGADNLQGFGGNDTFVFHVGQANGDTIVDFEGNGALAGDSLQFVGYGAGATFTQIDSAHWQVNYNANTQHEVITFNNLPAIHANDFAFV